MIGDSLGASFFNWITNVPGLNDFWDAAAIVGGNTVGAASGIVTGGLVLLLNRLPPGGNFPDQVHEAALYFGNALSFVNFILPVDALVWCISLVLLVKMTLWAFHIGRVVLNFLRGIPTNSYQWETPGGSPGLGDNDFWTWHAKQPKGYHNQPGWDYIP